MASRKKQNVFDIAVAQFERAAQALNLDNWLKVVLSQPKNGIIVNFPVRMDDGTFKTFKVIGFNTTTSWVLSRAV